MFRRQSCDAPSDRRLAARFISALVMTSALTLFLTACSSGNTGSSETLLKDIQSRGVLKVGMYLQYPPAEFRDPKTRQPEGSDVEIAKLLAKDLGVKIHIDDYDFNALIPSLVAKKDDILIASVAMTPERAAAVDFTQPYYELDNVILVKQNSPIRSLAQADKRLDQPNANISVVLGGISQVSAERDFQHANIKAVNTSSAALLLESGQVDAQITQYGNAVAYLKNHKNIRMIPGVISGSQPVAFAIRKGDPEFLNYLNTWIQFHKIQGDLAAILTKWNVQQKTQAATSPQG